MAEEMPPVVTRLLADISDLATGLAKGDALVKAYRDSASASLGGGKGVGERFGKDIAAGVQDAIPPGFTGGPGERIAKDLTDGIGRGIEDAAPGVQTKIRDTLGKGSAPAKESGSKVGAAFGLAFSDDLGERLQALSPKVESILGGNGKQAGVDFAAKFSEQVKVGLTSGSLINALGPGVTDALAKTQGDKAGFNFTEAMGGRVRGQLPTELETPVEESGKKAGTKAGAAAGNAAAQGMSPLILGAFAAAATAGPGLILAATAVAVLGAGVLVTHGNADLAGSYKKLGADASDAITKATAPLVPQIDASLTVLDQGIARVGPELKDLFAAVAPEATQMTAGLVSLAANALPGITAGLRSIQPYSHTIADDFGKLGTGVSDLFAGLATGARGGTIGFDALITTVEHLLGDVGQIAGALSNGLGPALHDISDVAIPVAGALTSVVKAFPPQDIRVAADAAAALFTVFKLASLAGLLAEGQTFVGFLGAAAAGEIALTGETGVLATAMTGLGAAVDVALGPVGLLTIGLGALALAGKNTDLVNAGLKGQMIDTGVSATVLGQKMQEAAAGSRSAWNGIDAMVGALRNAKDSGADASGELSKYDVALARLALTDKAQGAREYAEVTRILGLNAQQAAAAFPQYTGAISSNSTAMTTAADATQHYADNTDAALPPAERLISAVTNSQQQLVQQAVAAGLAAVSALSFAGSQDTLNTRISAAVDDYKLASDAATAFKNASDALFDKYADYSQAQATFTTDLATATGQLTRGRDAIDLHTAAGAKNFTQLNQLATANAQVADSLIKEGGSTGEATRSLQQGAIAIDALAAKSGFTKDQVDKLNIALYGVPKVKDITFNADTGPVRQQVGSLVRWIDSQTGTVTVQTKDGSGTTYNPKSGGKAYYDLGGWVDASPGAPVDAVVHGREYVLSQDMLAGRSRIDPAVVAALAARAATSPAAAAAGGYGGGYGGAAHITNNYVTVQGSLWRTGELMNEVRANSLQYDARNSTNGLSLAG